MTLGDDFEEGKALLAGLPLSHYSADPSFTVKV